MELAIKSRRRSKEETAEEGGGGAGRERGAEIAEGEVGVANREGRAAAAVEEAGERTAAGGVEKGNSRKNCSRRRRRRRQRQTEMNIDNDNCLLFAKRIPALHQAAQALRDCAGLQPFGD